MFYPQREISLSFSSYNLGGNLDIQRITLEYLNNEAGKAITFTGGEKISTVCRFKKAIKIEEMTEGPLDVTIPRMAVKEKAPEKIEINLGYLS